MHIAHLAGAENELLASLLEDEPGFVLRDDMRGAVVLLRQLLLPFCHLAGETDDHVVLIGLSVNRDGAECGAFDLHGLTSTALLAPCPILSPFRAKVWRSPPFPGAVKRRATPGAEQSPGPSTRICEAQY